MGRIRTIKPQFFLHEELFDLERETQLPVRLAFIGLWCQADREGRFRWRPRALSAQILPFDEVDFSRVLHALTTRGFVVKYASNGVDFGYIPTFHKHQVINNRESRSELPDPVASDSVLTTSTREARVDHAGAESTVHALVEGKGKERNKAASIPSTGNQEADDALGVWIQYKKERGERYKAQGLKALVGEVQKCVAEHGTEAMVAAMQKAMAANWKGWNFPESFAGAKAQIRKIPTAEINKEWDPWKDET